MRKGIAPVPDSVADRIGATIRRIGEADAGSPEAMNARTE
jgi:hypothetical protein